MTDEVDFYAVLLTRHSRRQLARVFGPPTWEARKCTWTDYEVTSAFAGLIIEGRTPILLHGWLADYEANIEEILAPLRSAGVSYAGECYGAGRVRLGEFVWHAADPSRGRNRPFSRISGLLRRILGGPVR